MPRVLEEEDGLGSGTDRAKGICLQWYRWEGEKGKVLRKQNDGGRGGGEGRGSGDWVVPD